MPIEKMRQGYLQQTERGIRYHSSDGNELSDTIIVPIRFIDFSFYLQTSFNEGGDRPPDYGGNGGGGDGSGNHFFVRTGPRGDFFEVAL